MVGHLPDTEFLSNSSFDEEFPPEDFRWLGEKGANLEQALRSALDACFASHQGRKSIAENVGLEWFEQHFSDKAAEINVVAKEIGEQIAMELTAIPTGYAKAEAVLRGALDSGLDAADQYEIAVWFADKGEDLGEIAAAERLWWLRARQSQDRMRQALTKYFWRASDHEAEFWPFYHLHFARRFGVTGFDDVWDEVYQDYGELLTTTPEEHPYLLMLLAHSPEVTDRLRPHIIIACDRLVQSQEKPGYWGNRNALPIRMPTGEFGWDPVTWATVMITLFLIRYGMEQHRSAIQSAVQWILGQQNQGGFWTRQPARERPARPDLITTALAIEAIHLTGADPNLLSVGPARTWLWAQQSETGEFSCDLPGLGSLETTLLVIRTEDRLAGRQHQVESMSGAKTLKAVILTAIPVEYQAVCSHLREATEDLHDSGQIYTRGKFCGRAQNWQVWVAQIGAGNSRAAQEVERAIRHINPHVALFVGVAGGLKDVKRGDIVAASKIYGYESGKAAPELQARPDVGESSFRLIQRARVEAGKQDWIAHVQSRKRGNPPTVWVGALASGEKVLASTQAHEVEFIRRVYGDALAVEMEGRGFLLACHSSPVEAMVIRGVSDMLDGKSKSDKAGWQARAADNASSFAFQVLDNLLGLPAQDSAR